MITEKIHAAAEAATTLMLGGSPERSLLATGNTSRRTSRACPRHNSLDRVVGGPVAFSRSGEFPPAALRYITDASRRPVSACVISARAEGEPLDALTKPSDGLPVENISFRGRHGCRSHTNWVGGHVLELEGSPRSPSRRHREVGLATEFEIKPNPSSSLQAVPTSHATLNEAMTAIASHMQGECTLDSQDWD